MTENRSFSIERSGEGNVDLAVGCDIGGTNCKTGLIDSGGNILEYRSFPADHDAGIEMFLKKLFATIEELTLNRQITGIGVLLPRYLRNNRHVPHIMVNIPMLEGVPLYDLLSDLPPYCYVVWGLVCIFLSKFS